MENKYSIEKTEDGYVHQKSIIQKMSAKKLRNYLQNKKLLYNKTEREIKELEYLSKNLSKEIEASRKEAEKKLREEVSKKFDSLEGHKLALKDLQIEIELIDKLIETDEELKKEVEEYENLTKDLTEKIKTINLERKKLDKEFDKIEEEFSKKVNE